MHAHRDREHTAVLNQAKPVRQRCPPYSTTQPAVQRSHLYKLSHLYKHSQLCNTASCTTQHSPNTAISSTEVRAGERYCSVMAWNNPRLAQGTHCNGGPRPKLQHPCTGHHQSLGPQVLSHDGATGPGVQTKLQPAGGALRCPWCWHDVCVCVCVCGGGGRTHVYLFHGIGYVDMSALQ
jgi:hypothetical protein